MGGHHERRSPKFALNSTFTISTTLNPATSFALFPQQRRVRAVAAGQREAWWVAHHPPASSAQHTNHQSANNSKQTQTSREPQLLANLQQGETTWKFPCFFWKFLGEGCGPRRLESWCAVEERKQAGNGNLFPDFATCTLPGSHTWTLWRQPFYWLVTVEKVEMRAFYMSSHPAEKMQLQAKLDDFQDRGWLHWHLKFAKIWATWF